MPEFYILLITIILMLLALLIVFKKDSISKKKKRIENLFDIKDLKRDIENYNKKETILNFHCEQLISKYYSKLLIFNKEYDINENETIEIKVNKIELTKSDFNENIILKSEEEEIKFLINICYNMNNHYQLILDKIDDPQSLEIVLYSKENKFPQNARGDKLILKDYEDNTIPFLKKFNLINISKDDFYKIYNNYSTVKLNEKKNETQLIKSNSLFVNFIIKNEDDIEGRIFEQKEELQYEDFTTEEINLLKDMKSITSNFTKDKIKIIKNLKFFIFNGYAKITEGKKKVVESITKKFSETCFFSKYYGKEIDEEIFDLMDSAIFIRYMVEVGESGINNYIEYVEYKNNIFSDKYGYNNFEKLILIINLQYFILKFEKFKILKFCDLPNDSPFVESEKLFFDIIKKLNENSALYFCYLQINSSSGFDYISSFTWFKIKFIPLIKIKAHLLYIRLPFFFIYEKADNKAVFVNPNNLIINFNSHRNVGYNNIKELEYERDEDSTIKILFLKFHESAHSKFESTMKVGPSPRCILNYELKKLDSHYDSIVEYKRGVELPDSEKKGFNIGEEGYAIEMYLYESVIKTDYLLKSLHDLNQFNNVNLYIGNNFKDLNDIFHNLIIEQIINKDLYQKEEEINNIKARNFQTKIKSNLNNVEEDKKTPIYFFNNYPLDASY